MGADQFGQHPFTHEILPLNRLAITPKNTPDAMIQGGNYGLHCTEIVM